MKEEIGLIAIAIAEKKSVKENYESNASFEAQTEWNEPEEYPDLRQYDEIAIDLETRDPNLKTLGSGSVIGR